MPQKDTLLTKIAYSEKWVLVLGYGLDKKANQI